MTYAALLKTEPHAAMPSASPPRWRRSLGCAARFIAGSLGLTVASGCSGLVDGLVDDDGAAESCVEDSRVVEAGEEFITPSGATVAHSELQAAVSIEVSADMVWDATNTSTVVHLTVAPHPDEGITAYTCSDELEGFSVPAHLTIESEDGILSEGFTGAIALTDELLYSYSYSIGLPLDIEEEQETAILPPALSCPAPRTHTLNLYMDSRAEGVELFQYGDIVVSSMNEDTGLAANCGRVAGFTIRG